jgi:hypothetical protein
MPREDTQFKPGNKLGGRKKGSRSKLGEAFLSAMHADFEAHGSEVIEKVRVEKPDAYLKVVASILPKELNVKVDPIEELTDDELTGLISGLARKLQIGVSESVDGAGEAQTLQ